MQRKLNPFEHLHTIIPFLMGENHWVTAVISIESRTIYVFDPLRNIYIDGKGEGSEGRCKTVFMVSLASYSFRLFSGHDADGVVGLRIRFEEDLNLPLNIVLPCTLCGSSLPCQSVRRWISEFEKAIKGADPARMEIDDNDGAEVEVVEWKSKFR